VRISDELVINELSQEVYDVAVDHGFHNPGGSGLDGDAIFLLALHGELSSYWEKLRKGVAVSPLNPNIIEIAKQKAILTNRLITLKPPIREGGELVDVGRMARFIVNLIGEASELWEATSENKLDQLCDKEHCDLSCEEEELADLAIRLMDLATARRVNLGRAIRIKSEYNKTRPFMHGKKA